MIDICEPGALPPTQWPNGHTALNFIHDPLLIHGTRNEFCILFSVSVEELFAPLRCVDIDLHSVFVFYPVRRGGPLAPETAGAKLIGKGCDKRRKHRMRK